MPTENNFTDHALNADENAKAIFSLSGRKVPTEKESSENYAQFMDEIESKMFLAEDKERPHWNTPQEPVVWGELKGEDFYKAVEQIIKENINKPDGQQKFPDYVTSHPEFQKAMASYLNISEEEFSKIQEKSTEIDKLTEGGKKPVIVGKRRRGILGSAYLHNRHLENIQMKKQRSDQAEFDQKVADAYKVVQTMNNSSTSAPGAKITPAVHFLNPYMAPFIEELLADNLRRIKFGKSFI